MSDGKITFSTAVDNKQLERDLQNAYKKIDQYTQKIAVKTRLKNQYSQKANLLGVDLDKQKAKLAEMKSAGDGSYAKEQIAEQAELVKQLQAEWNKVNDQVDKYTRQITEDTENMNQLKQKAVDVTEQLEEAAAAQDSFGDRTDIVTSKMGKLSNRISKLMANALVFSVISSGLRSLRDWAGDVVASNDEAASAIARLKGALLTMVQPLASVIIPAFTTFVNLLTAVVGKIAAFLSALGGKTVKESAAAASALNKQSSALGGVAESAKEAKKQLLGFDEINQLTDTDTSSAGGGGGGLSDTEPDFSWMDGVSEELERIADYVLLIGAGLALWKIGSTIGGALGDIISKLGLVLVAVGGILIAVDGIRDAWENGLDWGNMAEIILGVAAAAAALYAAFGNIAAGITLVVGGAAMMVTAFHDMMDNGMNLQNTLLLIAGTLAAGLGISLLVGSWIPMAIAAIASLLAAVVYFTGHGGELVEGLKQVCSGFMEFISGVFAGNWEQAWSGLVSVGKGALNMLISVVNSMISLVTSGINALFGLLSFNIDIGGHRIGLNLPQFTAPQIPYLAQGAVIPPNREFMAVLGDQTNGNNIEAPESLIRKIVREETAGNGSNDRVAELLEALISVVENIEVGDEVIGKAAARYTRRTSRARGV